jgi:prepilin-type N-terminal cleavage/methylation domain-containing protein
MKNRGFTLVEILGVIVILSLLVIGTYSVLDGISRRNKQNLYVVQQKEILDGAINFASNTKGVYLPDKYKGSEGCLTTIISETNTKKEKNNVCEVKIYLIAIVNEGILSEDLKNPIKDKKINLQQSYVTITYEEYDGSKIDTADNEKYSGRYKYTYKEVLEDE